MNIRFLTLAPAACATLGAASLAWAQPSPTGAPATAATGWQACTAMANDGERLACFDAWAARAPSRLAAVANPTGDRAPEGETRTAGESPAAPVATASANPDVAPVRRCNDPDRSLLSRVWELEEATDCGIFTLRGYRPNTLAVSMANSVNRQPSSPSPGHTAATPRDFQKHEMHIQLSLRTKLAKGIFANSPDAMDSLWLGYTQRSNWQLFNGDLSRPFRTTDHEPELMYVYPINRALPGGWTWRYAGIGVVHQSNGQSLPLSRSWNRAYLMTGLELDKRFMVQARIWKRFNEGASRDDNPRISDYVGRAELATVWQVNADHTLAATLRSSLGHTTRGSARLEWFRTIGRNLAGGPANLRFHTQLFTGYGDSLIDYNRKRTVLTVGFSLLDF